MLVGILLALLGGELFFRIVPFERLQYEVHYGHFGREALCRFLEYDPVLTLRNRRGADFPDAGVKINSLGLRGVEVQREKKPGVLRVLCLGDSCTFGAARSYPEHLQSLLDARFGSGRFEVLNAGVIGYTSLHGLEWYQRELVRLRPDIVTIYYGWNDLWRGDDRAIQEWFDHRVRHQTALGRSYLWKALAGSARAARRRAGRVEIPLQIEPERYREILEEFADLGVRDGFTPVFVTAPSAFTEDRTPSWMIEKGFVAPGDSAPRLRAIYNQVVIEVARNRRIALADCAAALAATEGPFFDRPDEDPIHPNDLGYQSIAEALAEAIAGIAPLHSIVSTPQPRGRKMKVREARRTEEP